MAANGDGVLRAIAQSSDTGWLRQCAAHNVQLGSIEIAESARQRLREVELAMALKRVQGQNTLDGRIMESLRIYRELLKHKHGRNQAAGYTERDIKNFGPKGALIKTIRSGKKTDGLRNLKDHGRLDCSYEQIAIDFADELPEDVVNQARKALLELEAIDD
jgi:hypothetical protein